MNNRFRDDTSPTADAGRIRLAESVSRSPRSRLSLACDAPHAVYLPEHYEPNYAYPLIVWFHGRGSNERDLLATIPAISERNYLGLALRGNRTSGAGAAWTDAGEHTWHVLHELTSALGHLRHLLSVHPDRIYLAGIDSGATMALRLMLQSPALFAGVIALGGAIPTCRAPLVRYRDLRARRVLLMTSERDPDLPVSRMIEYGRLLHSAGMQVGTRVYRTSSLLSGPVLREIDRWLMAGIHTSVGV